MKTLVMIAVLIFSHTVFAKAHAMNPQEFQKVLEFRETKENLFKPSEIYLLPISRNFDQGETDLCWIYATLNMLESASLISNPKMPVEYSRAVLQYFTMKDRFMRIIYNNETSTSEGGIEIDAINLIHENGIDFFRDYRDVIMTAGIYKSIEEKIAAVDDKGAKEKILNIELKKYFPSLPERSVAIERAKKLLGSREWTEYQISTDGFEGWKQENDIDARLGSMAYYTSLEKIIDLIHESLKLNKPLTVGTTDHALMLYGGEYNLDGRPVVYYIKDSSSGGTYRADADTLHSFLAEVTIFN